MFSAAESAASFPLEMLVAHIVTLPKPGKEPITPTNFHSISLLILDVKIYSKLLARQVLDILPTLNKPDQLGFTKHSPTF